MECVVCLESFEDDELLWLLLKCSYVFYIECIDEWFFLYFICFLCCMSFKFMIEEFNVGVLVVGEVLRCIFEVQEELFGFVRFVYDEDIVFDENEVFEGKLSLEIFFNFFVCFLIFVGLN